MTNDAVGLVDWLNLSIKLKNHGREFGVGLASIVITSLQRQANDAGMRLARIHFVAENYSDPVLAELAKHLNVRVHKTRTAKEQADLKIAVEAMDELHSNTGCPSMFLIATGDQDFIPLIERILEEPARVFLLAGTLADLSNEYRLIVAKHEIPLVGLIENEEVPLLRVEKNAYEGTLAIATLLRITLDGGILGGNQEANVRRIRSWYGEPYSSNAEERLEGWRRQFTSSEYRRVAVPGKAASGNREESRRRAFLDTSRADVLHVLMDLDWILRRCDTNRRVKKGDLGVGRFSEDDGSRVQTAVAVLTAMNWLVEAPDGSFENSFSWGSDGFIEPLVRLISVIQFGAYKKEAVGLSRDDVFRGLATQSLGRTQRRGGREAAELIEVGKRLGVIDTYFQKGGGFVLGVVLTNRLVRYVNSSIAVIKAQLTPGTWVAEHALLSGLDASEKAGQNPLFGHGDTDIRSLLRALVRSGVMERKTLEGERMIKLRNTAWVDRA